MILQLWREPSLILDRPCAELDPSPEEFRAALAALGGDEVDSGWVEPEGGVCACTVVLEVESERLEDGMPGMREASVGLMWR